MYSSALEGILVHFIILSCFSLLLYVALSSTNMICYGFYCVFIYSQALY